MLILPRIAVVVPLACVAIVAAAESAHAQASPNGRAYVSASLIGDIKRFGGDVDDPLFDGETIGAAVAIGVAVHPRWDLLAGVDVPRYTATSRERHVTFQRNVITLQSITENQTLSVNTLARFRGPGRGRVQFGYLAGLSIVRFRRNSHTEAPPNTPSALIPRADGTVGYAAGPTVGFDARVAVSPHLSVVPGLYATVFNVTETNGLVVRPRLSLRWTF